MERKMRKSNKLMDKSSVEALLNRALYGVLGTYGEDGYPYAVPLSYVYDDGCIYFHCAKNVGHKYENITFCNKVCFTVVDSVETISASFNTKFESAIAFGTVHEYEKPEKIFHKFIEKYSKGFEKEGQIYIDKAMGNASVYCIEIESMQGKFKH